MYVCFEKYITSFMPETVDTFAELVDLVIVKKVLPSIARYISK